MARPHLSYVKLRCANRLTMLLAVTFVFIVLRLSGDPVSMMLPDDTLAAIVAPNTVRCGASDRLLPEQYIRFIMVGACKAISVIRSGTIDRRLTVVLKRVPMTLLLGRSGFTITVVIGLFHRYRGGAEARQEHRPCAAMAFSIFGHSMPNFFRYALMILLFSMTLAPAAEFGRAT